MPKNMPASQIIRSHGRPKEFISPNGERVQRMERIFVKSHNQWYEQMESNTHFIYKTNGYGSSLMCTCGSTAGAFDYTAYRRYYSSYRGQLLCCVHFIQNGIHADGSHE